VLRRLLLVIALVFLLGLAWTGVSGGLSQLSQSHTPGQKAQTFSQLGFGVFGLMGAIATFVGRRWRGLILGCWAASLTVAASLASVVWGGTSIAIGILSGGAALLIALTTIWMLRFGTRTM
jgi:hypothetical protein